ncbi:Cytochrome protein, partial [Ophiophagus hannah]
MSSSDLILLLWQGDGGQPRQRQRVPTTRCCPALPDGGDFPTPDGHRFLACPPCLEEPQVRRLPTVSQGLQRMSLQGTPFSQTEASRTLSGHQGLQLGWPEPLAVGTEQIGKAFARERKVPPLLVTRTVLLQLNGEEWRSDRLILNKEVISPAGTRKFLPFLNTVAEDFVAFMYRQVRKNTRGSLTVDLYHDLFRFTLEGTGRPFRGGPTPAPSLSPLHAPHSAPTSLCFGAQPLFCMAPPFHPGSRVLGGGWAPHRAGPGSRGASHHGSPAWISSLPADKCIQNIYQEFCLGKPRKYSGIMAELLVQAELPLDSIKANVTELTAGGVDTVSAPLECAKYP